MSPRTVTVLGATGTQGSSVVNALLADGTFIPRAITRNDTSEAAKKLKAAGAEVFKADPTDIESLKKAIQGSEAVYLITFPFDPSFSEKAQATAILEASKAVGVKYLIWSTLPSIKEASGGKYSASHFDDKADIDKLVESSGIPHTKVVLGYFLENLWVYHNLKSNNTGGFDFTIPLSTEKSEHVFVWANKESGLSALALLKKYTESPAEVIDKRFVIATARLTYGQFTDILTKALGKKVNFVSAATVGVPALDESYEFQAKNGPGFDDVVIPEPKLVSWGALSSTIEDFVVANKAKLLAC